MNRDRLVLQGIVVLAALTMVSAVIDSHTSVFRAVLGLSLALALSGFALQSAVLPGGRLDGIETLLLSLGLSLALTLLTGIALSRSPWGLTPHSWLLSLGTVSLCGALAALVRWTAHPSPPLAIRIPPARALAQYTLALGLVVGALFVVRMGAQEQRSARPAQLWILPVTTEDRSITRLRLGMRNGQSAEEYRLVLRVEDRVLGEWSSIALSPGGTWETEITVTEVSGRPIPVRADLYHHDDPGGVYRHVDLWTPARD